MTTTLILLLVLVALIILLSETRGIIFKFFGWGDLGARQREREREEKKLVDDAARKAKESLDAANKKTEEKFHATVDGVDPADTIDRLAHPK